jgi:hypothetical protein
MENSMVMGVVATVISVGGIILSVLNHKRLRSNCCGKRLEVSLDVENTTPTGIKIAPEKVDSPEA